MSAARHLSVVGGHVLNLRPSVDPQTAQAIACGHPSVYDRAEHPEDRPMLPTLVVMALDRVGQFVRVPGCEITRAQAIEALDIVACWARPDLMEADATPPFGTVRP